MKSAGLLSLACGTFALGMAEFAMMGILSAVASSLDVTIPQAGDFISAYALGVSVGAPLPVFFQRYSHKKILLGLCCAIVIGNLISALADGYWMLVAGRFFSGLPHGGFFGVGAIVAVNLVQQGEKATAVAIMVSGMTCANVIGVPLATWLAFTWSWRYTFLMALLCGACAFLGISRWIPSQPPRSGIPFRREFDFLRRPAPWLIVAATFLGQGSIYCWYSYMEPTLGNVAHIPTASLKWVMIVTGLGMFLGGIISGRLADRFRPSLVCAFTALAIVPILLGIYLFSGIAWAAVGLAFLAAAALFALGGPMQYLIVKFSRGGEILGGACIQIAFNTSNALAAFIGGYVINAGFGFSATALAGIPMALGCVAILLWLSNSYKAEGA